MDLGLEEEGGGWGQGSCSPLISGSLISPFPWVTPDDGINGGRVLMVVFCWGSWYSISVGGITGTTGLVWVRAIQAWSATDILMEVDNLLLLWIPLHIGW